MMSSERRDRAKSGSKMLQQYRDTVLDLQLRTTVGGSGFDRNTWYGVNPVLDKWHAFVDEAIVNPEHANNTNLVSALANILDDDLVFHPPTYWKSRKGKMIGMFILQQVGGIFGKSFQYHRQIADATGTNIVLEFSALVDGIAAQGVDIITFNENSSNAKIVDFKVMIRPPEAIAKLRELMEIRVLEFTRTRGKL
eukprot:m.929312 g.929312  ORF g.929312 m.929312 type:complete len:195 (-) comp23781_c0_seq22:3209-3793(-)